MNQHFKQRFALVTYAVIAALAMGVPACGSDPLVSPSLPDAAGSDAAALPPRDGGAGEDGSIPADAGALVDGGALDASSNADAGSTRAFGVQFDRTVNAFLHVGNAWYVGGTFTAAGLVPAPGFLSIDTSGAVQAACDLQNGFDTDVYSSLVVGTSIYVGGVFSTYRGVSVGSLVKLDTSTCALDTTFTPPGTTRISGYVRALATAGTSLYVGGSFSTYDGKGVSNLAKLDLVTGALDTTFSPQGVPGPAHLISQ